MGASVTRVGTATGRIATLLYLAVHGACTPTGTGGAVELSWRLRPASSSLPDKFVDCVAADGAERGTVTRIRLDWQVEDATGFTSWPCTNNQGVTGFDLPSGVARLSVSPECDGKDALPATYVAPPPEERDSVAGQTITLGAVELVLQVNSCTLQPCICQ
jgi:hypothetical protein